MKITNGFITNERGEQIFLVGPDHEAELVDCNRANLDAIHAAGCNVFTATILGGDLNGQSGKANVHPFLDRSNPSKGYNWDVVNRWVNFCEDWCSRGPDHTVGLMWAENENLKELGGFWKQFFADYTKWFARCRAYHYPEEAPIKPDGTNPGRGFTRTEAIDRLTVLKGLVTQYGHLVGWHEPNGSGETEPWLQVKGLGLIDVVLLQRTLSDIGRMADKAFSDGQGQWAVIASELAPANEGFADKSPAKFLKWGTSSRALSGALAYLGPHDLQPVNHAEWSAMYEAVTKPDANVAGANVSNAFWRVAPWVSAEAGWKAGRVDVADGMAIHCEPGQIGAIETRGFCFTGSNQRSTWIYELPSGVIPEIRIRHIDRENRSVQWSGPQGGGEHVRTVPFQSMANRLCFDVLNFSDKPVTVRLKRVGY